MSGMFPFGVTITVRESGGFDPLGNPLPETERPVDGCAVRPGESEDIIDHVTGVSAEYVIYAPPSTDVPSTARVVLPDPWGGVWSVSGITRHWVNPFTGHRPGVEIYLSGRQG